MIYRQGEFLFEAHAGPGGVRVNVSSWTGDPNRGIDGFVCRGVLQFPLVEWEQFKADLRLEEG